MQGKDAMPRDLHLCCRMTDKRVSPTMALHKKAIWIGGVGLIAAGFAAGAVLFLGHPVNDDAVVSEAPKKIPDVILKDSLGRDIRLSDFAGSPIVAMVLAPWCSFCKEELPYLLELKQE